LSLAILPKAKKTIKLNVGTAEGFFELSENIKKAGAF
jgi:hypothetical protein